MHLFKDNLYRRHLKLSFKIFRTPLCQNFGVLKILFAFQYKNLGMGNFLHELFLDFCGMQVLHYRAMSAFYEYITLKSLLNWVFWSPLQKKLHMSIGRRIFFSMWNKKEYFHCVYLEFKHCFLNLLPSKQTLKPLFRQNWNKEKFLSIIVRLECGIKKNFHLTKHKANPLQLTLSLASSLLSE